MRALALLPLLVLASCRDDLHAVKASSLVPPVTSPEALPDAPVSGRIHGAPFVLRDARYIVDRRVGYSHTDIELSSGTSEAACGPISPRTSTSVWLRLEGAGRIETSNVRVGPGQSGRWAVHYQVWNGDTWEGKGDGSALVVLREAGPDGRVSGGIAVCFSDDAKSCLSGSFDAVACPPRIDQPVRGTPPPEAIPAIYLRRMADAGRL